MLYKCPHCTCTARMKNGKNKDGKQMFICKKCGKNYTDIEYTNIKCVYCNKKAVKYGIDKQGKQKYYCKHCDKHFIAEYLIKRVPKDIKNKIKMYVQFENILYKDIAKSFNLSESYVGKIKRSTKNSMKGGNNV